MPWYVSPLFAQAAAADRVSLPWYLHLIVALATLAVSFFLGGYLGKKLRMPDHGWKISLCLFTLLASLAIVLMGPRFKLGVDLSGGVILVYEVDQSKKTPGETVDMDKLVAAVAKRVNPGGQKEVTIRKYGTEEIEIIIPEVDEVEVQRIERIISTTGNLEFRILANQRNDKELIERALADPSSQKILDSQRNLLAWWVPVKEGEERSFAGYSEIARRTRKVGQREITEILVEKDIYNVTGGYLTRAEVGTDQKGQPCVNFMFNNAGGQLFGELTGSHLPESVSGFTYKLGIILDGQLYSAPSIQSRISDRGEITGSFTRQEVQDLVNVLNAGSLPAALTKDPISKLYSGPTLGRDTIQKSTNAMLIACLLVPLFMLWYYRFSGIVANIALVLNMLMLVAIMLTIKAAFTLTGFAGLALTVGMAVDNNVLVYERLREELERGATLRMAIRNAFHRASATIIDCNLTHLIAATVLYMVGSDQLRGFAVTLWLGVAISMYTSVFVARVIFEIADKRQWITRLKMLRLIGHTEIDFMGWFPYCLTASILITVMAIVVSVYRGQGLFDIDFTGGTSVQALFSKPQDTGQVRHVLSAKLPDLAVSDVRVADEEPGLRFDVNTSEPDLQKVKRELSQVFGDKLARNAVTLVTRPTVIEDAAKGTAPAPEKSKAKAAEPPPKKQSRRDLPSNRLLAVAGGDSGGQSTVGSRQLAVGSEPWPQLLVAMAGEKTTPTKTTPTKTAPGKPSAQPKPATDASAEPAAPAKPVEVQRTKSPPRKLLPTDTGEKGKAAAETPAPGPNPYAGWSEARVRFKLPLNYRAVDQLITSAAEALQIAPESVASHVSSTDRNYTEGDLTAYPEWDVKLLLPGGLEKSTALLNKLQQQVADNPIFPASSTIGGAVAGSTRLQAVYALIASWVCIIIYLWVRFQGVAFGLAAVIGLIHDVFVMLGAIAVSIYIAPFLGFLMVEPFKINLPIVAAFLTIIGYSVNDTIVVFDRIREVRGKDPDMTRKMVNDSTNQTLSRTLLTSFTVLLVVVVLYFFGGDAIHGFAFALVVGVITGTYSSVYVSAPILLWLVGQHKGKAA
jgi:SecD/SecF fusion protein